jgi:hypothetical protein
VADLITHALVAHVLGRPRLATHSLAWLVTGSLVPDLASRAPRQLLGLVGNALHWSMASTSPIGELYAGLLFLHTPAALLAMSAIAALTLPRRLVAVPGRPAVFALLVVGAALHVAIDVLQYHPRPSYRLLYPLSDQAWELGWVSPTASLWALPGLLLLSGWVERRVRTANAALERFEDGAADEDGSTQREEL